LKAVLVFCKIIFYSTGTINLLTNRVNSIVKILLLRLTADRYFGVDDKVPKEFFSAFSLPTRWTKPRALV